MKLCFSADSPDGTIDALVSTSDQDVVLRIFWPDHAASNRGHLFWCLTAPENHFGKALAQRAVMIDFREAEIFRRQVPQPLDCVIDRKSARLQSLEQPPDVPLVHCDLSFRERS